MVQIAPFKGVLYNSEHIDDISSVVAPPYDVISEEMQDSLYMMHPYNIVRLILGKTTSEDTRFNTRYTRARDYLEEWLNKGILKVDIAPAFYIYQQGYLHDGKEKSRIGFIGLMKIEDPRTSKVLPHEYTFSEPKKDRLKLICEVRANLSPIFSLFEDERSFATNLISKSIKNPPFIDIETDGVRHKLWRMQDANSINKLRHFMKSRQIFIADGHHRYEASLVFRDLMKKKGCGKKAFDYTMVYFSNLNQDALTILSTHRVIKDIGGLTKRTLLLRLKDIFQIKKIKSIKRLFQSLKKTKRLCFGLYCGKGRFYLLTLKDEKILDKHISLKKSVQWKRLPVTILHQLVFSIILKIKEKVAKEKNIIYTRDIDDAVTLVDKKGYETAFFLNPTSISQFKDVAKSRDRMPHKSTYFYPKLLSGLVMNKF